MKTFDLNWRGNRLELGTRTCIMGIVNVTPDSFSDGGRFFDSDTAVAHALELVDAGADILDIGGESTRPFSESISAEEESLRVLPVIEKLAGLIDVPISIDTTKSAVARRAISAGASIINDISALEFDPDMGKTAAETGALLVLMHMKGSPKTMQVNPVYKDLIGEVHGYLSDAVRRAEAAGVKRESIIIDQGIGFGKTVDHNIELINKLDCFEDIGVPVLIGPSRKAFIRKLLENADGKDQLVPDHDLVERGTQAVITAAILNGAHIVRVHNVADTRATAQIADALRMHRSSER